MRIDHLHDVIQVILEREAAEHFYLDEEAYPCVENDYMLRFCDEIRQLIAGVDDMVKCGEDPHVLLQCYA